MAEEIAEDLRAALAQIEDILGDLQARADEAAKAVADVEPPSNPDVAAPKP